MGRFTTVQLCLSIALTLGCTRYNASYSPGGSKGKTGGAGQIPTSNVATSADGKPVNPSAATDKPSVFLLASSKFQGKESNLQAVVTFAGMAARSALVANGASATASIAGLPVDTNGELIVELYEGEQLRFIAKRAGTTFERGKENQIAIDDCRILPAPWEGKSHDGSCTWTIEEVAN